MNGSNRKFFLWLTAASVFVAAGISIYQIAARSIACGDLICQLGYAASYGSLAGMPLGAFVLLGAIALVLILAVLELVPKGLGTVGRFGTLAICIVGLLLTLRIAAVETFLLHGWSRSCVVAAWLAAIVLCVGIILTSVWQFPRTRIHGATVVFGAIVVAGLSWHLMQAGGITRVHRQDKDSRLLFSAQRHSLGSNTARIQIVEFADFECPPCRHVAPDLRKLVSKYGDNVRLIQREYPNVRRHPQAQRAAEIAECFGEQGKYWEAAAELYRSTVPDDKQLGVMASRLGADTSQITACMMEHRGLPAVTQDRQDGHALGVSVTPTLFIGNTVLEGSTSMDKLEGLLRSEITGHPQTLQSDSTHLIPVSSGCSVQDQPEGKKEPDTPCR